MRNEGLAQLKQLAITDNRRKFPDFPEAARFVKPYSDKTANELQRAIIDFLNFSGHFCERISVTGRYIDNSKIVTDVLGSKRRVGSGKWIKSSMQPGSADLSAIINGMSYKLEIKIGRDKQSDLQKQYQRGVEMAGGKYWLIHNFDEFLNYYNTLQNGKLEQY
jgi:hypothetical protein